MPSRSRSAGSASSRSNAAASAAGSPGGTNSPLTPGSTASGTPPTRLATTGLPRPPYDGLYSTLQPLSSADLRTRADALHRAFLDQGVTFALKGVERPFPLDIVPRIIAADECG